MTSGLLDRTPSATMTSTGPFGGDGGVRDSDNATKLLGDSAMADVSMPSPANARAVAPAVSVTATPEFGPYATGLETRASGSATSYATLSRNVEKFDSDEKGNVSVDGGEDGENVTYLFRTPRGRIATLALPPSASYDALMIGLLEAAARRDGAGEGGGESRRLGEIGVVEGGAISPAGVAEMQVDGIGRSYHGKSQQCLLSSETPKRGRAASASVSDLPCPGDQHDELDAGERKVRRKTKSDSTTPSLSRLNGPISAVADDSGRAEGMGRITPDSASIATAGAYVMHDGRVLDQERYRALLLRQRGAAGTPGYREGGGEVHLTLRLRLVGGMADRQNRVGSKFGGGGVSSAQQSERERKERLRQLALESVDLARDPYLMRNHLGTYECKLCLTLHTNEGNYLAHTQGKKHQAGLARRAMMEKKAAGNRDASLGPSPLVSVSAGASPASQRACHVRIGRPGYSVSKSRDAHTNQRCLTFELHYPELDDPDSVQPRHRFMSAYEQRVESPPDRRYQYLLVACDPYETVAFKVPNEPIDRGEGRFVTNWDREGRRFTVSFYLMNPEEEKEGKGSKTGREGHGLKE